METVSCRGGELASQVNCVRKGGRFQDKAALAGLFTDGWVLDYELPVARGIYDVCKDYLANSQGNAAVKKWIRDAFYVDTDLWRGMVLGQFRGAVRQATIG